MGENGNRSFTYQALIFTWIILALVLLAGIAWWVTLAPAPARIATTFTQSAIPTASATPFATRTITPRPTWTPRPSLTASNTPIPEASQTPTPDRLPTLVKARPDQYNDNYVLTTWDVEKAAEAARRMREYPDILFKKPKERATKAYNDAFRYASITYQESLLRYPDDPQAEDWRWGLAYSLARLGDARAVEFYISFLREALRDGALPLVQLPAWFTEREPALSLSIHKLPNMPGQLGQSLLEIEGGILIWLLQTPEQIYLYPLTTRFDFYPRPNGNATTTYLSTDLSGDSIPELVIYIAPPASDFTSPEPRVFDLTQTTPVELPVSPTYPVDFKEAFTPSLEAASQSGSFILSLKFYAACPVRLTRPYTWNGTTFLPGEIDLELTLPDEDLQRCESILTHAETYWEPPLAAEISQALLPVWPPDLDPKGRLYPTDARLGMLYRHAVSLALAGNQALAQQTFQSILDEPLSPESDWKQAAQAFLSTYQAPRDLYRACVEAPNCNPSTALRQINQSSGISDPALLQEFLRTSGVTIRSAGIFDFDLDGANERWITVQHHLGERLEFWILASSKQGAQALFLSYIEVNQPTIYFSVSSPGIPVFQLAPRLGYRLLVHAESGFPYLISQPVEPALTTYTRDALYAAEVSLFSGVSPNEIRRDLELVLNSGRFNCKTHSICDRFYYLLGLVYELNGQPRAAIDTYLKLWWENSSSPLTTVARLKLKLVQIVRATPTRTKTAISYPTINPYVEPAATASPTPYPTANFGGYPTPAP